MPTIRNILIKNMFVLAGILGLASCARTPPDPPEQPTGRIRFAISHEVNSSNLTRNELLYKNQAGNEYMVTGLKYFISDITFWNRKGSGQMISQWKDIFYIDEDIPETKQILFPDHIPAGIYDSVSFIFGISGEKNKSFMYVNPPEVIMGWPEVLGGGYHYMMLDGKWKDTTGILQPFNFHLGIGQLYKGSGYNVDSIYAYVQNWFRVSLPGSGFTINSGDTLSFRLTMNIESWFATPYVYDHNHWGGAIMQKQPAMQMARENGRDVFSFGMIR